MNDEPRVVVVEAALDLILARQKGRALGEQLGFSPTDVTLIVTAISELARNIINYAKEGEIVIQPVERDGRIGILITARDKGPGIPDIGLALQQGFSTSGSLGLGLPGVRRIMDEFELRSVYGEGTSITAVKWKP